MTLPKILIATTNQGKFSELASHFSDAPFEFVSLKDVGLETFDVPEPFNTTWENALHKARFFAEKSGLLTISEDTAFYVNYLGGVPGVHAKRYGANDAERMAKVLAGLEGVPEEQRTAYFEAHACLFNPETNSFTLFVGRIDGLIPVSTQGTIREGMSYDSLFFYPPLNKCLAEVSIAEKNAVSHRGQLARQIKIFLLRQYSFKQIVCPVALIVKDRKLFLNKRRDTNEKMNNKWEFPGGGVDNGEEVLDCLRREAKEETGFDINVIAPLPKVYTVSGNVGTTDPYQVFLVPHVAEIIGGELKLAEEESAGHGWFTLNEALELDLLPLNKTALREHRAWLSTYID